MAGNNGLQDVRAHAGLVAAKGQDDAHALAAALERVAAAIEQQTRAITNLIAAWHEEFGEGEPAQPRTYMDGTPIGGA